jgi:hypothetical protein
MATAAIGDNLTADPIEIESLRVDEGARNDRSCARRITWGKAIGSAMEFYDFAVYGYLPSTLSVMFFSKQDHTAAPLSTFAVFAAAFLLRPFGGILFGHIGDRAGRRGVLAFTVLSMSVITFLTELLPGYAQIGMLALLLILVLRCAQASSRRRDRRRGVLRRPGGTPGTAGNDVQHHRDGCAGGLPSRLGSGRRAEPAPHWRTARGGMARTVPPRAPGRDHRPLHPLETRGLAGLR